MQESEKGNTPGLIAYNYNSSSDGYPLQLKKFIEEMKTWTTSLIIIIFVYCGHCNVPVILKARRCVNQLITTNQVCGCCCSVRIINLWVDALTGCLAISEAVHHKIPVIELITKA